MMLFKCSNIGNCIAVKGKFRAASAVYPRNNWEGFLKCRSASNVTDGSNTVEDFEADAPDGLLIIWAFYLRTSAGVSINMTPTRLLQTLKFELALLNSVWIRGLHTLRCG